MNYNKKERIIRFLYKKNSIKKSKQYVKKTIKPSFRQNSSEICKNSFGKLYLNLTSKTLKSPRKHPDKVQLLAKFVICYLQVIKNCE